MKVALITGANAGIGKEVARQLGALETAEKIYLACRNEEKATAAKADLEARTGKSIFEIVLMDVSDPSSVRAAIQSIRRPVDALVMNAGGIGGGEPLALTKDERVGSGTSFLAVSKPRSSHAHVCDRC